MFDPTGMVVSASYDDTSTKSVTGYTYTPNGALTTSDTVITISYTEDSVTKTTTQAITVAIKMYTQAELEAMTIAEIQAIASERGYTITETLKADIITEFLAQQV